MPDASVPDHGLPPYAVRAAPTRGGNPALRPVPEDELEELDEDLSEWDISGWGRDDDRLPDTRSPAERIRADSEAASACVAGALGPALKARRWALGESQAAYARRTERAQSLVSVLERGGRHLTVADLVTLALETGRTVRLQVLPEGRPLESGSERVSATATADGGSVRIAIGRDQDRGRDGPGATYRLPWTIS